MSQLSSSKQEKQNDQICDASSPVEPAVRKSTKSSILSVDGFDLVSPFREHLRCQVMTNEVKTRKLCDSAQSDINQPACEIVVPANELYLQATVSRAAFPVRTQPR